MAFKKHFSLRALLVLTLLVSFALEAKRTDKDLLDPTVWEETVKQSHYTTETPTPESENRKLSLPNHWQTIGKWLVFAVLGVLFVFLILYFYKRIPEGDSQRKKSQKFVFESIADAESNLLEADLDKMLAKELRESNYNGALRLLFLKALQQLHSANQIQWKRHKTNGDYLRELGSFSSLERFAILHRYYEKAWYGSAVISLQQYEQLTPIYQKLVAELNTTEA